MKYISDEVIIIIHSVLLDFPWVAKDLKFFSLFNVGTYTNSQSDSALFFMGFDVFDT